MEAFIFGLALGIPLGRVLYLLFVIWEDRRLIGGPPCGGGEITLAQWESMRTRLTESPIQRGNRSGGPTTPKPEIIPTYQSRTDRGQPMRCASRATIAECGGPCEQGFHHCDCGLLQQLNPPLKRTPNPPPSEP
jgi:hypothetical protein